MISARSEFAGAPCSRRTRTITITFTMEVSYASDHAGPIPQEGEAQHPDRTETHQSDRLSVHLAVLRVIRDLRPISDPIHALPVFFPLGCSRTYEVYRTSQL